MTEFAVFINRLVLLTTIIITTKLEKYSKKDSLCRKFCTIT